jgi:hypothetical protein
MQPKIKRRTFLQGLLALPASVFLPKHVTQETASLITYTDSEGNTDLNALHDGNLTTGIEYPA